MASVREFLEKINIDADIRYNEPLSMHTTFRIGGPADAWVAPRSADALAALVRRARADGVPCVVLGGGANVLVGDRGVRGIVASTENLSAITVAGECLEAEAGAAVTAVCAAAAQAALAGLEFAAGLPGSVGGAVYMNARCYDREIADILVSADWLDTDGRAHKLRAKDFIWEYKRTPFMADGAAALGIVTRAVFSLQPGDSVAIRAIMREHEADRLAKGHFDHPCAGSVFKNNRSFGRPTGKILDELGFRGRTVGGAKVSEKHANIFVNSGGAKAADMRALIEQAQQAAHDTFGYELEPEVVFLGEF